MRLILFSIAVLICITGIATGIPTLVQAADTDKISVKTDKAVLLDEMFAELRRAKNEKLAADVADRIKDEWNRSGSATVDLLMQWASEAIGKKDYPTALDFLDQVTVLKPEFAEGWNRRATAHFLAGNYAKSMTDIERTLELEPRHFGALSGMGMIFMDLDKKALALAALRKALDVYPQLRDVQKQVGELEEQLAGSRI